MRAIPLEMSVQTFAALHGIDRDALLRVVEPIVSAHGAELVDLELKPERGQRGGWVLRVTVEKAGASAGLLSTRDAAVGLELCADVSRDLSPALDVADVIAHAYTLEVSSPGVERPLRSERDFARFAGQPAKIKLRERDPGTGQRVVAGTLQGVSGGKVRVAEGSRVHEVPLSSIEKAHLVFQFGSSKPQHNRKRGRGPASQHD